MSKWHKSKSTGVKSSVNTERGTLIGPPALGSSRELTTMWSLELKTFKHRNWGREGLQNQL